MWLLLTFTSSWRRMVLRSIKSLQRWRTNRPRATASNKVFALMFLILGTLQWQNKTQLSYQNISLWHEATDNTSFNWNVGSHSITYILGSILHAYCKVNEEVVSYSAKHTHRYSFSQELVDWTKTKSWLNGGLIFERLITLKYMCCSVPASCVSR